MSEMETRRGRIKLVENLEGESTYERKALELLGGYKSEDFDTEDWKAKSSASYAYGILDYKWIVGAPATSV